MLRTGSEHIERPQDGRAVYNRQRAGGRRHGVDGFLFHPSHLPGGLDDFVALVIPELQSRGLFRAEYEGTTIR